MKTYLNRLNLTKSFVVLCFISLLSICVFSQNYNYQAVGMKLDNAGNIFVVGKRYTTADDSDVLLVKYSASGIQLWAQFYNGPDGKNDEPSDIDIDDSGNIYISGKTLNTASNYDYLTLKYSNDGQLLWAKNYNGPAAYTDEAEAIVVNINGSVYVTGTCTNLGVGSDDDDIMTIKYDTNGNILWSKSYSGSPDDKDVGVDIGIDSTGNVYVTGYSLTASNYEDYVLIKYTNTGTQSWVKTYNGTGGDYDIPTKLFVDENDNIYVTGYSYGGASGEDWATLKYDVNGNLQWGKRYNGTVDGNDRPSSIAVDFAGDVYVAGYSDNFPNFNDMTTVKYNSAGTQLWINKFDGPISYNDDAVDVAVYNNNVFVFGKSYGSTLYDYVLIKYELDGTKDWLARYNKGDETPVAIAIDSVGNIYVTGSTKDASGVSDFLTIRYNQSRQEVWVRGIKGGTLVFDDTFDSGAEGWFFTSVLGISSGTTPTGALAITYNNTSAFSYWRRPLTGADPDIDPLSANQLYRAVMNVSSFVTSSSTPGDIPDFRVATGLANGASELYFVSSFLSNGGSNYISPLAAGRDYNIYFEATGLPAGQTSPLVMQFEGFNFPFGGRPNLINTIVGLNRAELSTFSSYDVNATGTVIHSITDAAGFNIGSGTANGWNYTTFTTSGQNAGAVGAKHADNEGLVITGNPMGSYTWIYGSWDANPGLAASFSSGVLYRATFKITTVTVASAIVNQPIPQVRIQTGDNHVAVAGNLFSNNGSTNNKQLTNDEASTPPIDLWFYYDGATRTAGSFNENKIYPSFEFLVLPGVNIPDGAALTLRSYELSEQITP